MSINRSEQFLYLQNKAKHYENIKKMKPTVRDKLENSYRNTIDHSPQRRLRGNPYNIEYQTRVSNDNLIRRLIKIAGSDRTQVGQGFYSRYNKNQRSFRSKNPYDHETKRKISIENEQFVKRLSNTKPRVGVHSGWEKDFQQQEKHKKLRRSFDDNEQSKSSLKIYKNQFIPQPLRIYMNDSLNETVDGKDVVQIKRGDLIRFPNILKKSGNNRSSSELNISLGQKSNENLEQLK